MSQLSIGQNNAGESVTIEDIGSINVINEEVDDLISYDGKAALSVTVLAKEGVNISALQDSITSRINTLSGNYQLLLRWINSTHKVRL